MRIGSLCSGAGGLDLAVEHVFGATTAWHCEINAAASQVLAKHWPGIPNHGDITAIDWDTVEPVDILTGGYPCQPFSQAGQRKGTSDERHIWPHVREAIRRIRPRFAILENVSGHRTLGFDRVLGDLAEDGADVCWTSIRAADVGAAHGRERLWILVTPNAASKFGSSITPRHDAGALDAAGARASNRDGAGNLAARVQQLGRSSGDQPPVDLLPTPQARDGAGAKTPEQIAARRTTNGGPPRNLNDVVVNDLLSTPQARDRRGAPSDGFCDNSLPRDILEIAAGGWGRYEPAVRRWEALTRPAPAPAEPSSNGKPRVRAEFSEWLMGWPDGWVTDLPISRTDKLVAIGNGVVPQQAAAAIRALLTLETEAS